MFTSIPNSQSPGRNKHDKRRCYILYDPIFCILKTTLLGSQVRELEVCFIIFLKYLFYRIRKRCLRGGGIYTGNITLCCLVSRIPMKTNFLSLQME